MKNNYKPTMVRVLAMVAAIVTAFGASVTEAADSVVAYVITVPEGGTAASYQLGGKSFEVAAGSTREVPLDISEVKISKGSTLDVKILRENGDTLLVTFNVLSDFSAASLDASAFTADNSAFSMVLATTTMDGGGRAVYDPVQDSVAEYDASGKLISNSASEHVRFRVGLSQVTAEIGNATSGVSYRGSSTNPQTDGN